MLAHADNEVYMQDHGNSQREARPMNLGIQTVHIGGDDLSPPPRYRVKATDENGTALGAQPALSSTEHPMYCGNQRIMVVNLLMDDTREVRTYADDALETLD